MFIPKRLSKFMGSEITGAPLIYLRVEQGCRGGFWQRRDFGHPQIEGFIQMEQRADHAGPQTAHPGDGLEVARQLNINTVVSEWRGGKH